MRRVEGGSKTARSGPPHAGRRRGITLALVGAIAGAIIGGAVGQAPPPPAASRPADPPAAATAGDEPFRFGSYQFTIDGLTDPSAVAIADDGTIYIAEAGESRISAFAADGSPLGSFGGPGGEPGRLLVPQGLAHHPSGTLFVADTGNHRIQVFDAAGAFVRSWGTYGTGPGEFNEPHGIAVDDERVYVADLGNDRVQVFDHEGGFEFTIGSRGAAEGNFNRPIAVAIDEDGFIYVADADNNRIQKFDGAGDVVASWGDWGPFSGLMDRPSGIVLRGGEVYVADTRNHRVQIFDAVGDLHLQWGIHAIRLHEGAGRLHYPNALAIAPSAAFGVICESFENRCQIFAAGDPRQAKPARAIAIKAKQSHFGASIDTDGRLLTIAEPETHLVHFFDMKKAVPILIGSFGERGTLFGQMIRTAGLELDLERRLLYVTDTATRRIQTYSLDFDPTESPRYDPRRARFIRAFDLGRLSATLTDVDLGWVIEPTEIERGPDGNLYLVDARNSMILVFDGELTFVRAWGGYGTEPGRFRKPTGLAFGREGDTVLVVDANNHRVQVFDLEGTFRRAWGGPGDGDGQFKRVFGIAAGRDGFVYVTDSGTHRVQKFTEAGDHVATWGGFGTDHGLFWKPRGVEQDDQLRVLVVDQGNHRAQIFSPDGTWLVTCGTGRSFTPERLERERVRQEAREKEARERASGKDGQ